MRVLVAQAGLNENGGIVADDRVDAGELGARQDHAGQPKRNQIPPLKQRLAGSPKTDGPPVLLFFDDLPHFSELNLNLLR